MRAEHQHRMLPFMLALLLAGCGASATPSVQRREAIAAAPTRSVSAPPSHTARATIDPSPIPTPRAIGTAVGAVTPPRACTGRSSGVYPGFSSVAALAWVSQQIVAGVVVEQRAPIWVALDADTRHIHTDYVVRVDHQLRGFPTATVVVRRLGGTLDGCVQDNASQPPLVVGDALLLFLHGPTLSDKPTQPYFVVGGSQGHWRLAPDGTVAPALTHAYLEAAGLPLVDVAAQVRAALSRPPPIAAVPQLVVPLDRAPLPPASTPTTPTR